MVHRMIERAVQMEGTVTGEHGVGLVKRDYLEGELGKDTVDAMRRVSLLSTDWLRCVTNRCVTTQLKLAYDPLCLLNCDKVVRVV